MSDKLYFEVNGEELLKAAGLKKAEFARRLGIHKQNVNSVFSTKNILILRKASEILEVPFELLISYPEEPNLDDLNQYSDISSLPECSILDNSQSSSSNNNDRYGKDYKVKQFKRWYRANKILEFIKKCNLSKYELKWIEGNVCHDREKEIAELKQEVMDTGLPEYIKEIFCNALDVTDTIDLSESERIRYEVDMKMYTNTMEQLRRIYKANYEKGMKLAALEVATRMKEHGIKTECIVECTSLSAEEIDAL